MQFQPYDLLLFAAFIAVLLFLFTGDADYSVEDEPPLRDPDDIPPPTPCVPLPKNIDLLNPDKCPHS